MIPPESANEIIFIGWKEKYANKLPHLFETVIKKFQVIRIEIYLIFNI